MPKGRLWKELAPRRAQTAGRAWSPRLCAWGGREAMEMSGDVCRVETRGHTLQVCMYSDTYHHSLRFCRVSETLIKNFNGHIIKMFCSGPNRCLTRCTTFPVHFK